MSQSQEYVVRVPKETKKRFHVMRFSAALKVDVTTWRSGRLERENNIKEFKGNGDEMPKFGAGSEFGKELKEEARRKKYGISTKKYNPDDQPWVLRINGREGRKFKGTREGGVSENTSYYVFFQAHDGAFEAFPVSEWYNFIPIPKYKALTAEEAEEKFTKRDKILNYFPVMAQKKKEAQGADAAEEKIIKKRKKDFKISDMDDWMDSDEARSDESDEDKKPDKKVKPGKKGKKGKGKKKKGSDEDDDSEPQEDSDEGDFDQREVDYMSDTSSEEEEEEKKVDKSLLKGVADEDALRQLVISEDEDEEENEEKKTDANAEKTSADDPKKTSEVDGKVKIKQEKDDAKSSSSSSSEDSDDSDFDDAKFQSAMFMQKKVNKSKNGTESNNNSKPNTPPDGLATEEKEEKYKPSGSTKRKLGSEMGNSKKQRTIDSNYGITEEAIRRYLMRKPMTTTELLQKFYSKKITVSGIDRDDFMASFTQILKKVNPEKQTINGKLYLSIKP